MDLIMTGVGVFLGDFQELLDQDATIVFDRTTTTINIWHAKTQKQISTQTLIMDTNQARRHALKNQVVVPNSMSVFLDRPLILGQGEMYDIEHNLLPTDVTNHFSGYPITLMGADLWTCYGQAIFDDQDKLQPMIFSRVGERRRGRCSFLEGQLPYFLFWPFL